MCHIPNGGRSLRIAVVQVASQPGQITVNQAHALPFIERAVEQRAQLVILPELFACGYVPNQSIWHYGETRAGPTVTWLRATSKRLGIYLGAGWLEIEGRSTRFLVYVAAPPEVLFPWDQYLIVGWPSSSC